jgi:hypothetical protein
MDWWLRLAPWARRRRARQAVRRSIDAARAAQAAEQQAARTRIIDLAHGPKSTPAATPADSGDLDIMQPPNMPRWNDRPARPDTSTVTAAQVWRANEGRWMA